MEILWKIVNFIILFGALYLVCRKMNLFDKMFGSRRRGIGDEIESSEKAKAQAKALGADIDKVRAENEERKQQLLRDAEAQAKADGEAIAASGEEEAKSLLTNAEKSEVSIYRAFSETAKNEGFEDISDLMLKIADVEGHHEVIFRYLYENFKNGTLFSSEKDTVYECSNCGFKYTAKQAFSVCPLCNVSQGFVKLQLPK